MLKEHHTLYKSIRASSLVFPFGVGAMIDLPEGAFMTVSCDWWNKRDLTIVHDERLEKILRVKGFKSPVVKMGDVDRNIFIPFVQFPSWMFCPKCRSLKSLSDWQRQYRKMKKKDEDMKQLICPKCNVKLSPARIVTVCEHGHIDDFPWIQWVHYRNNKSICNHPDLYIKTSGSSSGLEGITLECKNCNTKSSLSSAFNRNIFEELEKKAIDKEIFEEQYSLRCSGNRPWDGEISKCTLFPQTLQRGATNIYFPKVESSLLIPPYTEKVNNDVEQSNSYNDLNSTLTMLEQSQILDSDIVRKLIESSYVKISKEINLPIDVVKKIVDRKLEKVENEDNSLENKVKYKEDEYRALIGEFGYDKIQQVDFKVELIEGINYNRDYINKVVLIHKLREVRALTGFSRINSPDANIMEVDDEQGDATLIRPLKDKTWYPAIEVKGEGIFIEFNENIVNSWVKSNNKVTERAEKINRRYNAILNKRGHSERKVSAKFMFLHTFAHLIKELSFKCGYSSTSLRERIYCNSDDEGYSMSGILIYTANGDSEGTLGGLVRQGRNDRLNDIIDLAIEKARFCSSDPVCSESMGQGRDALNLSSCYSCTLISETSCEEFNTLLDRAMIVGTLEDESIGFFNFVNN